LFYQRQTPTSDIIKALTRLADSRNLIEQTLFTMHLFNDRLAGTRWAFAKT
jgi:hypothetical protein